jgi:hypothetical protein
MHGHSGVLTLNSIPLPIPLVFRIALWPDQTTIHFACWRRSTNTIETTSFAVRDDYNVLCPRYLELPFHQNEYCEIVLLKL